MIAILFSRLYAIEDYRCNGVFLCDENSCENVASLKEAFQEGNVAGHMRVAYINQNNDATITPNTYATAIGGEIKYETADIYHMSAAVSMFISQKVASVSGDFNKNKLNLDFFDSDGSSVSYVGESYINYNHQKLDIRVGRQKLDTPFNDRDDIRMLPNTFNAAMVGYGGVKDFVFVGGYIDSWAGYDSGQDISHFKDIPGEIAATGKIGRHVILAGVTNKSFTNLEMQAWYYGFDKEADIIYLNSEYIWNANEKSSVFIGLQYAQYEERASSQVDGHVYGGDFGFTYKKLNFNLAYNNVTASQNKTITIGYGGGPYYTSMEEMTIDSMNSATAYVMGLDIDFSSILIKDLGLSYSFGHFDGKDSSADVEYEEHDIVASYTVSENFDLEASFALVNDKKNSGANDGGYKRTLIRMNYYFQK